MQQGQANILIARFPDPSYGVKMVNFIINSPHLLWAIPRFPRHVTWRFLLCPWLTVPRKPLPCQNKGDLIWISENKANNNALGQTPTSLHKSAESILGFTKGYHLEVPTMPMWPGFNVVSLRSFLKRLLWEARSLSTHTPLLTKLTSLKIITDKNNATNNQTSNIITIDIYIRVLHIFLHHFLTSWFT